MVLLSFLLVPMVLATANKLRSETYAMHIEKNILKMVYAINTLSDHLELSSLSLRGIGKNVFRDLNFVKTLNLSNNRLNTLPKFLFSPLTNLEHLDLARNPLTEFQNAFVGLNNLKVLNISNCRMEYLKKGDFFGLPKSTNILTLGNPFGRLSKAVFEESIDPVSNEGLKILICHQKGITRVRSLRVLRELENFPRDCREVKIIDETDLSEDKKYTVSLRQLGISVFVSGWYHLQGVPVDTLDLEGNDINRVTSELLNDLPQDLTSVRLSENKIERLEKGTIVNRHLRQLNFTGNSINEIEDNALKNTQLSHLLLTGNRLKNISFVASLPSTLIQIILRQNEISDLPAGSFSGMKKLVYLNLAGNKITEVGSESLHGLLSLKELLLQNNGLANIHPDSFQDLKALITLDLSDNRLINLDKELFHRVRNLRHLNLKNNRLTTLPEYVFANLNSLRSLYLANNTLLGFKNTFVGLNNLQVLSISNNSIRYLNENSFIEFTKWTNILTRGNLFPPTSKIVFADRIDPAFNNSLKIILCHQDGIVRSLEVLREPGGIPKDCARVQIEIGLDVDGNRERKVILRRLGITRFKNGWYRLHGVVVNSLDLRNNNIARVTRKLLNHLPRDVTFVSLANNTIKRLEAGMIVNENLRRLDLGYNSISEIDDDALVNTKLLGLSLACNQLKNTRFVGTLPSTLMVMILGGNKINQLTDGSFYKLNKLIHLDLIGNMIPVITPESLWGLSSLEELLLHGNRVVRIEPGSFQDLKALTTLNLGHNMLTSLDKGIFHGLESIEYVAIDYNKLTTITKDSLAGLSDTLLSLHLSWNQIENVENGSFVGVPKSTLSFANNKLKKVESGSFNLPDLELLSLAGNLLTELNGDYFKNMRGLKKLRLAGNRITKIEKGFAKYLSQLSVLDISKNPIRKLENGVFFGLSKTPEGKYDGSIQLRDVKLELIQSGLFDDL